MAKLFLIPTEHCEKVWPLAEEFVSSAVKYSDGLVKVGDLKAGVIRGSHQLWVIWEGKDICKAAGITEIINGTCFIWAFGGEDMREWFPLHLQLEAWAKECGCKAAQFFGRLGWMRALRDTGYERRLVVMRKEL